MDRRLVARTAGLERGAERVDQATLAIATDDQLSSEAAARHGLPQFGRYNNSGAVDAPIQAGPYIVVRDGDGRTDAMRVGASNAFTRYMKTSAERGAAGSVRTTDAAPTRIRVTRLRSR